MVARFVRCGGSVAIPAIPTSVNAEVVLPADTDISGYGIHPALLDAALHPLAAVLHNDGADGAGVGRRGYRSCSPGWCCMPARPPGCWCG